MEPSSLNLGILIFAIGSAIFIYLYNQSKDKESKESEQNAIEERNQIDKKVGETNTNIGEVRALLEGKLEEIILKRQNEWNKTYPYGWVLFGKTEEPTKGGVLEIKEGTKYFFSDWRDFSVEKIVEEIDGEMKERYKFNIPEYVQGNIPNIKSENFKGLKAPALYTTRPIIKKDKPTDITIVRNFDQPHIWFTILEGKPTEENFVYLLGFAKNPMFDYEGWPEKFAAKYNVEAFLRAYNAELKKRNLH